MRKLRYYANIIALSMVVFLVSPAWAQNLSPKQKQETEQLIADYFMQNPETLARALNNMQEHFRRQEAQQQQQAVKENASLLYADEDDFFLGAKNAPITIVEFFDYNCGYCKRAFEPVISTANENKDVRLVFKEFPILSPASRRAAEFALVMANSQQYLTYHSKLMTLSAPANAAAISKVLREMRLNEKALARKIAKNQAYIDARLETVASLAGKLGITGTPAFVVNGKIYPGAPTTDDLQEIIKRAREDLDKKTN